MSRRYLVGLFFSVFAPISTPALANKVWIVDASGGGNFTQIQPAVDAAADRDTILIKSGDYAGFTLDDKPLTVVGDSGAIVWVNGQVTIRNIQAGEVVLIGGLRVDETSMTALISTNNSGSLRFQAARFVGHPEAVLAVSSPDLYFTECDMTGRDGPPANSGHTFGYPGGHALHLIGSSAALYFCTLRAGDGGAGDGNWCYGDGGWGGNGCFVSSGFLFASGSFFYGGDGGHGRDGDCFSCGGPGYGGNGGAGIAINGIEGHLLGCTVRGGSAGIGGTDWNRTCGGWDGSPGPAIDNPHLVPVIAGTPRRFTAPLVARAASSVPLVFWGQPGDIVRYQYSRQTDFSFSAAFKGVFIVPPTTPVKSVVEEITPIQLTRHVLLQAFDPGELGQSCTYFLQSSHRQGIPDWTLGTGRSLVVLDPSF